jgi:pimeloyl-ACP methyl ester carboxylesterase
MADHHSHVTSAGLWAQEIGEGPLVVLVHGSMDRSGGMLRVRRVLQGDHRVIRYDRRGYGRSLRAGRAAGFDQQVDDLVEVTGGRPAVLVGHSFGGLVCLALAERRPELAPAVVAYEAPELWAPWWPATSVGVQALARAGADRPAHEAGGAGDLAAHEADGEDDLAAHEAGGEDDLAAEEAAEWFLRRMIGDRTWEKLPASMRAERRAEGPALLADMRSVRPPHPVPFDPGAITVPVLSAFGSESRPYHMRAADDLARAVPRGELAVVAGASHGAHLSHPGEFAGLVRRGVELAGLGDAAEGAGR